MLKMKRRKRACRLQSRNRTKQIRIIKPFVVKFQVQL